ncbi:hypothetical protein TNCV_2666861 [Trichonephila clavipes]|nr:hypothetical protein TNCV_2666861 [Trichonephila clavipes]
MFLVTKDARRNRRQYEQLTDFDRGRKKEKQVGRIDVSAATFGAIWFLWITEGRVYRRGGQCRLDFCRPRATWSVTDWRRVIFSDESQFSLSADDHRTRVPGAPASGPIRHLLSSGPKYSNFM